MLSKTLFRKGLKNELIKQRKVFQVWKAETLCRDRKINFKELGGGLDSSGVITGRCDNTSLSPKRKKKKNHSVSCSADTAASPATPSAPPAADTQTDVIWRITDR